MLRYLNMTIDQIKTFVLSPNAIRQMRYRYGIEPEEYYQLLLKTNGFCTLCEVPFSKGEKQGGTQRRGGHLPCVDHCYTTGEGARAFMFIMQHRIRPILRLQYVIKKSS